MPHVNRQRRMANERRRQVAADKQKPLPLAEQRERAEARLAAHRRRYPYPPVYRTHVSKGG